MKLFAQKDIPPLTLPGRRVWKGVGRDAHVASEKITFGYARYAADYGPMDPHNHAEEVCFVVEAKKAWVRFGPEKDQLGEKLPLEPGMTMHFPSLEWHVFGYDEGGYLEILFIYGQVDHIRPEDMK